MSYSAGPSKEGRMQMTQRCPEKGQHLQKKAEVHGEFPGGPDVGLYTFTAVAPDRKTKIPQAAQHCQEVAKKTTTANPPPIKSRQRLI